MFLKYPIIGMGNECEIYYEEERFVIYVPDKENFTAKTQMDYTNFIDADAEARKIGFETMWG